ncbi:MAG: DNA-formamidopyrimidine glycosylase [Micrococcales bacterium 73-15]|nr:MAG: DNA-formamidopyrimidine glycosylase [Micrococcales bacterium 73-15]
MPELPEVETVRAGLADHVLGRVVAGVDVHNPRTVRRLPGGAGQLADELTGTRLRAAVRRGKFLWLLLDDAAAGSDAPGAGSALLVHLGMSGQLLVRDRLTAEAGAEHPHLRARLHLAPDDSGRSLDADAAEAPGVPVVLDFVDQRTFGYLATDRLVATPDGAPGGLGAPDPLVPASAAHIGRDLLDPAVDLGVLARALRGRRSAVKRALLDQTLVSGVGNIYADEALWRARVHPEQPAPTLSARAARTVLESAAEVMRAALVAGGTSFAALYVNVNGASGYFDRSLEVYGREGEPCSRCGAPVRRASFMNRSSHFCSRCQRRR